MSLCLHKFKQLEAERYPVPFFDKEALFWNSSNHLREFLSVHKNLWPKNKRKLFGEYTTSSEHEWFAKYYQDQ